MTFADLQHGDTVFLDANTLFTTPPPIPPSPSGSLVSNFISSAYERMAAYQQ